MKVTGPGQTQGAASARKAGRRAEGGEGFSVDAGAAPSGAGAATGLSSASAISSVDALLAVQGAGDFTGARKRASERALTLLDVLDDLKIALLEGGIPRAKLTRLMDALASRRDQVGDPKLEAMLDEVETRAAVELAKYDA